MELGTRPFLFFFCRVQNSYQYYDISIRTYLKDEAPSGGDSLCGLVTTPNPIFVLDSFIVCGVWDECVVTTDDVTFSPAVVNDVVAKLLSVGEVLDVVES